MKITRFEDIESWKKARELTHSIYEITSKSKIKTDFGLKDQIQSASVSIMNNTCLPVGRLLKVLIPVHQNHL